MRILMVTATYPPSVNGVAVSVENLKNTLIELGHEVKVLAPKNKKEKKDRDVLRYPSVTNPLVKDYPIALFPGLKSVYKIITTFKPDIIHTHHPFQIGFFAKLLAENFGVPLVFTYHTRYDLYAEKYAEFLPKKVKVKFIEKSVDDFCKKVDLIISPSVFLKKHLKEKFGYKNIQTVPGALPQMEKTVLSKKEIRKLLKIPLDKKVLLVVSRLGKEKNLDVLLEAIKHLSSDYFLVLAGEGPDEKRLKSIVKKLSIGKKVKFAGKVLHSKINLYYQSADIFCYSSQTETQGLVFLEAMNFGLPIITVDSPAAAEWINRSAGVIVENEAKDLVEKILNLNSKKIKSMSKESKKFAEKFDSKKMASKMIKLYRHEIIKKND